MPKGINRISWKKADSTVNESVNITSDIVSNVNSYEHNWTGDYSFAAKFSNLFVIYARFIAYLFGIISDFDENHVEAKFEYWFTGTLKMPPKSSFSETGLILLMAPR